MGDSRVPFVSRASLSPESFVYPTSTVKDASGSVTCIFATTVNVNTLAWPYVHLQDGPEAITVDFLDQPAPNRIRVVPFTQPVAPNQILHSGTGANSMGQTPAGVRVGPFARFVP